MVRGVDPIHFGGQELLVNNYQVFLDYSHRQEHAPSKHINYQHNRQALSIFHKTELQIALYY